LGSLNDVSQKFLKLGAIDEEQENYYFLINCWEPLSRVRGQMFPRDCDPPQAPTAQLKVVTFLNSVEARKTCWRPLDFIEQSFEEKCVRSGVRF